MAIHTPWHFVFVKLHSYLKGISSMTMKQYKLECYVLVPTLKFVLQFSTFRIWRIISKRSVHLGKVTNCMVQSVRRGRIQTLLRFHGALHDSMVRLESLHIFLIRLENVLLDALAEAVFAN